MKVKTMVLASVVTLTCAASSFAAISWLSGADTPASGASQAINVTGSPAMVFKPSSNVQIGYEAGGSGAAYLLGAYHISGSFVYATSSVDTGIYRHTSGANTTRALVNANAVFPAAPTSSASVMDWVTTAWTLSK